MKKCLLAVATAVALAGCGSSGSTSAAACLKQTLNAFGTTSGKCSDSDPSPILTQAENSAKAADAASPEGAPSPITNVTCTNKVGNEYVCAADGTQYQITFDGTNIVFS
jgi:hypothetical protein